MRTGRWGGISSPFYSLLLLVPMFIIYALGFPGGSEVKASACKGGDLGSIPGLGRSPGEGNGNPLQYSCLQNPVDGGAWWAIVHRVAKSQTWLNDLTFTFTLIDIKHFRNGYTLHRLEKKRPNTSGADKSWIYFMILGSSVCLPSSKNKHLLRILHVKLFLIESTWAWWWHKKEYIGLCCLGLVREIFSEDKI